MSQSTITPEQRDAIAAFVGSHHIPSGLGTREEACSIAAINLALTGELTDGVPACMSLVIGRWIIHLQDAMPEAMRNGTEWKSLLPYAAGTGRDHEREKARFALLMEWMWETVLPIMQSAADINGFGKAWRRMCEEKTGTSARYAAGAADAAYASGDTYTVYTARGAYVAARSAAAAANASYAADVADAAYAIARAVVYAATSSADADAWSKFNPCALLRELIEITP